MPTIDFLSKNKKIITNFHLKIIFLIAIKRCNILHGSVFVMIFILSFFEDAAQISHSPLVGCTEMKH